MNGDIKVLHAGDLNAANWLSAGLAVPVTAIDNIPIAGSAEFLNAAAKLKKILKLDKPDLIISMERAGVDVPILSIEITKTTPQSQHAKQRIPRLIAAAEVDVACIYIIPAHKMSGGTMYHLGADLYFGVRQIRTINNVPVLVFPYPDQNGNLIDDHGYPGQPAQVSPSMVDAFGVINEIVNYCLVNGPSSAPLIGLPRVSATLAVQDIIAGSIAINLDSYDSLEEINTADLAAYLLANTQMTSARVNQTIARLPARITARPRTIFFRPTGRLLDHANDPYSGMLAFFDYAFCRWGRDTEDRNRNLIYMPMGPDIYNITDEFAPDGYHRFWAEKCPLQSTGVPTVDQQFRISHHLEYGCVFTKTKPLRILSYFSDLIVFQDAVLVF